MKIYVDAILLLNFGFDFLLLLATSYLLKRNISIYKIIIGTLFGSLSILFLFLPISSFSLFLFKIVISVGMILITFSFKNIHYFFKNIIYLYFNSMLLGGFLYLLNIQFSYKHTGLIFYHNGLSVNFFLLIILSPVMIYFYIKQLKHLKCNQKNYYKITFTLNNKYQLNGFLDTGNQTQSIYFHKGIHILNKNILKEDVEYFYEPITTIHGTSLMKCFKVHEIIVDDKIVKDVIFGISEEYFKLDVDVILNSKIWEEMNVKLDN